jgi:predicted deacylase
MPKDEARAETKDPGHHNEAQGETDTRTIRIGDADFVTPGQFMHMTIKISESSTGRPVQTPIFIANSKEPGPALFLIAGIHGNELNGIGAIRQLIDQLDGAQLKGTLICMPVVNVPGFLAGTRTLPNAEDINRLFPGDKDGSPGERIADMLMQVLSQCDYGITIHTAVDNWFNMVHTRADVSDPENRRLARALGCEVMVNEVAMEGMLRRAMTDIGVPCVLIEAGEPNTFDRTIIDQVVISVKNAMVDLGMVPGQRKEPLFRVIVKKTELIRADHGGIIDMKVAPRQLVYEKDPLFSITNPFGKERDIQKAPFTGMVLGIRTRPIAAPGTPVVHLLKLDKTLSKVEERLKETQKVVVAEATVPALVGTEENVMELEVKDGQKSDEDDEPV